MAKSYFVADVHLGLTTCDPHERELRFARFLRELPADTENLFLLGDIWDFWYEYRDVVPKGYVRVLSALIELMDRGVNVYFFQGNHDVWTYHYFEELGMKRLEQPYMVFVGGKTLCLGHGDGLGPCPFGYRILRAIFHSPVLQWLFSLLHPYIAFSFGNGWSRGKRKKRLYPYQFKGADEALFKFADEYAREKTAAGMPIDYFIFGHYHADVRLALPSGGELIVLKDWLRSSPYACLDHENGELITVNQ
ncbi:MAG: UDP-2,3-diacylglucosamine diphosphatase [Bacteroidales bacterium]|nr:UDP-2,3-diacylglucosamine diphosphatase [Bacteroidales bacterium]MBQ2452770.1 UDP-2,3-diacylglucosamine diphosphatase [Bacteroidales bacterium]